MACNIFRKVSTLESLTTVLESRYAEYVKYGSPDVHPLGFSCVFFSEHSSPLRITKKMASEERDSAGV